MENIVGCAPVIGCMFKDSEHRKRIDLELIQNQGRKLNQNIPNYLHCYAFEWIEI